MKDSEIIEAVLKGCGWKYGKPYFDHDGEWHIELALDPFDWSEESKWAGEPPSLDKCKIEVHPLGQSILTSLDACHAVLPMKDVAFREFVWFNIASHWDELLDMTARDWCMAYLAWLRFKGVESK